MFLRAARFDISLSLNAFRTVILLVTLDLIRGSILLISDVRVPVGGVGVTQLGPAHDWSP